MPRSSQRQPARSFSPEAEPEPAADGRQRLPPQPSLRGCSTADLTKRLKQLHSDLVAFDQDLVDPSSLDDVARDLIHHSLLLHKDKGVKAYVGACLVDILRLYAPDAPYTPAELKDLFDFVIRLFRHVGSANDPHQAEYFYTVDSLASVKSIVLICDLDAADELVVQVFRECFDTISTTSPKNVELALSDILLALLEELQSIPPTVVDILTAQFLPKAIKARPAAFRLATDVCKGASDKLQRYVSQYFGETIMAVLEGKAGGGSSADESDEDSDAPAARKKNAKGKGKGKKVAGAKGGGGGEDDLPAHFVEAHELIRSLNRHVPSLLLSVIPQLEAELVTTSSPSYRRLATSVLGAMFGEPPGHGDLAKAFPGTWKLWGERCRDRDPKVRVKVAERVGKVWREHPELSRDIEGILHRLLVDTDEKVRLAACHVYANEDGMDYETAAHHVSREALEALAGRVQDRKDKVRAVAFNALGRLYGLAYPEIESRDEVAIRHFGWIPETLLDSLKYKSEGSATTQRNLVDSTFSTYILPRPSSEKDAEADTPAWVDRFLIVERSIHAQPHKAALMNLTKLADRRAGGSPWSAFVQAAEKWNSGIVDDDDQKSAIKDFLKKTIKTIAAHMPDPAKAASDLNEFAKHNVGQLYKELKVMLDPQTDLKTFLKNERDFLRRIEKLSPSMTQTFTTFILLSCYTYISRSSIPQLLKRLQGGSSTSTSAAASEADQFAASAARVLEFVSKSRPVLYKAHTAELSKILADEAAETRTVEVVLHAVAKLKKAEAKVPVDSKLAKRALHFGQSGNETQAKQAATLIALDKDKPGTLDDLVSHILDALPAATDDELPAYFAALARVARYGQRAFEEKSETITAAALEVLTRSGGKAEAIDEDDDLTWQDDMDLAPLTRARVLSVKILVNRCLSYARTDNAAKVAKPVFDLLWPLLQMQGGGEETYSVPVASRLRLAAALALLKLLASLDPTYTKEIVPRLDLLARLSQDACFEVREQFLTKLVSYLRERRMHPQILPRVNMILFLVAHEPEADLKDVVVNFARSRRRLSDDERQALWETPFLRLIHMLAHHPDFEGEEHEPEEIKTVAKYFELYLDVFATAENISYLFYLATLVKTVQDKHSSEYNTNLYILSELAQHLIKGVAKRHNWPIPTYPANLSLPGDIFQKIPSASEAKKIAAKTYLDDSMLAKLDVKPEKKKVAPRKRSSPAGAKAPKAKRVKKSTPTKARRKSGSGKKKDDWDSDEDAKDESSEEEEEESEEDDVGASDDDAPPKPKKASANGKATPTSRGQRGNLRSDPKKSVVKGLGESSDEDEDGMDVDGAASGGGTDGEVVAAANGKGKGKAKAPASPAAKAKPAASRTPKKATPAKAKTSPTPKGKKAAASPAAAKGKKGTAAKKAALAEEPTQARRAQRGLKQPRAMKKMDAGEVSDVGDTEDEDEDEDEEMASGDD
ncbi:hypothetical protein JCM10213_006284 [Rhodosporidiobolus nylandii]